MKMQMGLSVVLTLIDKPISRAARLCLIKSTTQIGMEVGEMGRRESCSCGQLGAKKSKWIALCAAQYQQQTNGKSHPVIRNGKFLSVCEVEGKFLVQILGHVAINLLNGWR